MGACISAWFTWEKVEEKDSDRGKGEDTSGAKDEDWQLYKLMSKDNDDDDKGLHEDETELACVSSRLQVGFSLFWYIWPFAPLSPLLMSCSWSFNSVMGHSITYCPLTWLEIEARTRTLTTSCWRTTFSSSDQGRFPSSARGWKVPMPWDFVSSQLSWHRPGRPVWEGWGLDKEADIQGPSLGGETDQFNPSDGWKLPLPWSEWALRSCVWFGHVDHL